MAPGTLTNRERLDREIAALRMSGLASDRKENSQGICTVAKRRTLHAKPGLCAPT